jgi:hypothetical protein
LGVETSGEVKVACTELRPIQTERIRRVANDEQKEGAEVDVFELVANPLFWAFAPGQFAVEDLAQEGGLH